MPAPPGKETQNTRLSASHRFGPARAFPQLMSSANAPAATWWPRQEPRAVRSMRILASRTIEILHGCPCIPAEPAHLPHDSIMSVLLPFQFLSLRVCRSPVIFVFERQINFLDHHVQRYRRGTHDQTDKTTPGRVCIRVKD